jgi:hypothetical protein
MSPADPPTLMPVSRIIEQARIRPLAVMPRVSTHQSYPIPVRGGRRGMVMHFLYCPRKIEDPKAGLTLWPPTFVAILDAYTGKLEEMRKLTPGEFGPRHPADQRLGHCRTPGQAEEDEFLIKLAYWYQAVDTMLPLFVKRAFGLTHEEQEEARKLSQLNAEILEPPLMPYYQAIGREYFDWLSLVTPAR